MDAPIKPSNPSAFPNTIVNNQGIIIGGNNGMTLRDYFANSAMQGICNNAGRNGVNFSEVEKISEMSYLLADAMLKQREL